MKSTLSLVLTLTFLFGCAQIASQTPQSVSGVRPGS
jgi:hypothetical protein